MNPDVTVFIVEYYEMIQNQISDIGNAYAEGAKMVIFEKNNPIKSIASNFYRYIPQGKRKIIKYSGDTVNNQLYIHVQSIVEQPYNNQKIDEAFICILTETSIMILYHSMHMLPLLEPISQLPPPPPQKVFVKAPPPPPKVIQQPVEVDTPEKIDQSCATLVTNMPFQVPPKEFLPILQPFGQITHYCQNKGQLLVQFSKKPEMYDSLTLTSVEWNGRNVNVRRCPKELKWGPQENKR